VTYFTDSKSALEEAQYLAEENKQRMYIVQVEPAQLQVMTADEAGASTGRVLETIIPVGGHSIF